MKNLDPAEQLHIWAHSGGDRMESQHVGEMGMETPPHTPTWRVIYNGQFLEEEEAVLFKNVIPW